VAGTEDGGGRSSQRVGERLEEKPEVERAAPWETLCGFQKVLDGGWRGKAGCDRRKHLAILTAEEGEVKVNGRE